MDVTVHRWPALLNKLNHNMVFLESRLKKFENKIEGYLPLGGRAQLFFVNRSIKSWISIAKSAYILLSSD